MNAIIVQSVVRGFNWLDPKKTEARSTLHLALQVWVAYLLVMMIIVLFIVTVLIGSEWVSYLLLSGGWLFLGTTKPSDLLLEIRSILIVGIGAATIIAFLGEWYYGLKALLRWRNKLVRRESVLCFSANLFYKIVGLILLGALRFTW